MGCGRLSFEDIGLGCFFFRGCDEVRQKVGGEVFQVGCVCGQTGLLYCAVLCCAVLDLCCGKYVGEQSK